MEARSSPVAVDRRDSRLDRSLAAPLVMELILEEASERAELKDEVKEERAEAGRVVVTGGRVVVICWACGFFYVRLGWLG
jgi:hypothetical protein